MLLEATLSGFSASDSQLHRFDRLKMGLLDTTNNTSRLISAMLTEQSSAENLSHNHPSYTSPTSVNVGMYQYEMNKLQSQNSQQQTAGRYMSDNPSSESDSRSPKSSAVPTCVVAPSANQRDLGMDSDGDDSGGLAYIPSRKQREFIPENRKDEGYWEKRRKNNEAARRSREKRRVHDMALENRIMDLTRDNCSLRTELVSIKKRFGVPVDDVMNDGPDHQGSQSQMNVMSPSRTTPHLTQQSMSSDLQQQQQQQQQHHQHQQQQQHHPCPPSPLHQSPSSRSKNSAGPLPHPSHYLSSFYQHHNAASPFPPSQLSMEALYRGRSVHEPEDKPPALPGKYDSSASIPMKSIPDEITYQQRRIEDQLRPMYSSSLPPNQAPPYHMNPLGVASSKSYWVPTTEMTSSDSNDDSEWNDQVQDQPLSLVKKRPSTEAESGSELSNNSSRASFSPPTSSSSALPHKLRHKLTQEYISNSIPSSVISPYSNGLAHLSDIAMSRQKIPSATVDDFQLESHFGPFRNRSRSYSNPRSMFDTKYIERRKKNNEAARKCRENRKSLTRIREMKSGYLENENNKLKDELGNLQDEMRELRDLLEKKRQDKELESLSSEGQHESERDERSSERRDNSRVDDDDVTVKLETDDTDIDMSSGGHN